MADDKLAKRQKTSLVTSDAVEAAMEVAEAVKKLRDEGSELLAQELESRAARTVGDVLTLGELRARMQEAAALAAVTDIDLMPESVQTELCTLVEHALGVCGGSSNRMASLAGEGTRAFVRGVMDSDAWARHLSDDTRREPMIGMLKNLALARAAEILARPATSDDMLRVQERTARWVSESFIAPGGKAPPKKTGRPDNAEDWFRRARGER